VYGTVFAIALGWVLYIGKDIFVPIVFSVLVVYVIVGLSRLLSRIPVLGPKLPMKLHYALSILLIALALVAATLLIVANLSKVVALAPQYQASLLAMIQRGAAMLGLESEPTWATLRLYMLEQVSLQRLVGSTVLSISSLLASLVVVSLYVAFLLIEQRMLPNKLANISSDPGSRARLHRIIAHINDRVGTYLALKTLVSLLVGFVSWAIMAMLGLEFAAFWAVLIFLLNYIPYVGSFLSIFFPVTFAILQFGDLQMVLLTLLTLSAAQFFIGNFLDPYLMANSLNLSPFAILVSLTVWTALWGIPGAFLAVPITACITMVLAGFEGTRPVAVLLSRGGQVDGEQ
jgi:predicted PurR-regulated permease PerM